MLEIVLVLVGHVGDVLDMDGGLCLRRDAHTAEADGGPVTGKGIMRAAPVQVHGHPLFHLGHVAQARQRCQAGREGEVLEVEAGGIADGFQGLFQAYAGTEQEHAGEGGRGIFRAGPEHA